ncbi:MAG TPA: DUF4175 family protein [Kofleriaceae bacterium]|nr:DUF4175 family protein [Kofleriaceae bacterium]
MPVTILARRAAVLVVAAALALAGCQRAGRPGRTVYNQAVAALGKGDLEAARKGLLDAMNRAGFDDDLRFRANFDLASVEAKKAEAALAAKPRDVDGALASYRKAMAWLGDASRIRPDDADTRANLERIQARILAIIDEANKGKNSLEHRLDEAIEAERNLRDAARKLWADQDARGAGADPLADKDTFDAAAARQQLLGTETGVIADLAGDEITAIGGKAEDKRTDEEKVRLVQLQNLDLYIQDARKEMVDARRNLHDLHGELAHGRTEAALAALKRAREQLLDPVAVLQGVASDQLQTAQLTGALDAMSKGTIGKDGQKAPPPPAWLTAATLNGDQQALKARLEEVKARFQAGLGSGEATPAPGTPPDPKAAERERLRGLITQAMPALDDAMAAMTRATDALGAGDPAKALDAQRDALLAMSRAIELFLQLRKLVDVALAEQQDIVNALTPAADGKETMSAADREKAVTEGTARNKDRLARMQGLIAAEKAKLAAEAQAGGQGAGGANSAGGAGGQGADQKAAQATALYDQLESLRSQAAMAVDDLATVAAGGKGAPALDSAKTAQDRLAEMQKLMFSVLEHLQELIRDQGETRDQTAKMELEDDAGRLPLLPGLIEREGKHAQMADAIAQALAQQADAASQGGAQGGPPGGDDQPSPQAFSEAAGEVRNARTSMQDASDGLSKAKEVSATMSYNLQPVLEAEKQAKEHLENALRLLTPPPKQQDGDQQKDQKDQKQGQGQQGQQQQDQQQQDQQQQQNQQDQQQQDQQQGQQDQQQQDQQQQQQQGQKPDQQQSADEAERRLQQVREREAQRQRDQQQRQRLSPEPVERDW